MNYAEAVKRVQGMVGASAGTAMYEDDNKALAVLSALAESEAGLRAENDRLTERATWFKNVNADWEAWAERSEKDRGVLAKENAALKLERDKWKDALEKAIRESEHYNAVKQERAALKAEVELLGKNAMNDYAAHLELKARAEKAEAELDALRREADAARKALMEVDEDVASGDSGLMNSTRFAVRKALAYREGKEKPCE